MLANTPPGRENDKVGQGCAGSGRWGCQDGEDGWIAVIVGDRVDGLEAAQVVLEGSIVALPGNDIERRVVLQVSSRMDKVVVID